MYHNGKSLIKTYRFEVSLQVRCFMYVNLSAASHVSTTRCCGVKVTVIIIKCHNFFLNIFAHFAVELLFTITSGIVFIRNTYVLIQSGQRTIRGQKIYGCLWIEYYIVCTFLVERIHEFHLVLHKT